MGSKGTVIDRLTLFTETPHPAVWAGASIWTLADTSVLAWEPTDSWKENKVIPNSRISRSQYLSDAGFREEKRNTEKEFQHVRRGTCWWLLP